MNLNDTHSALNRGIALTLTSVLFWGSVLSSAAQAQSVVVDPRAGGNTGVGAAGNGVPMVNINTPNGQGLSHNHYSDYNVGTNGLILNNNHQPSVPTQLGGVVGANPNLTGAPAQVILNEVTSSNPSRLNGYTEVAGGRAHVIVANPNGITCDGCGFINTPKATLTTGTPVVENGQLKRYSVSGGQVAIEGQGLNAKNVDQFEIITRAAQINAEIHAQDLAIIAGRNDVDATTLKATAKADDGSEKPQLAIDSSVLGGMYANTIRLVGTESGVGVRLQGDAAASAGDLTIDVNGKLELANIAAQHTLDIKAPHIVLDQARAGERAHLTGALEVKARLSARNIEIAGAAFKNRGITEAEADFLLKSLIVDNEGSLTAGGSLRGEGQRLTNTGTLVGFNVSLDYAHLSNAIETFFAEDPLVPSGLGEAAGDPPTGGGTIGALWGLRIEAEQLENAGLIASGADMVLLVKALTNEAGDIYSGGNLLIAGNAAGEAAERFINRSGTVESAKHLTVHADTLINERSVLDIETQKIASMTYAGCGDCSGGKQDFFVLLDEVIKTDAVEASAPAWLVAGGNLVLEGQDILNSSSLIAAGGDLHIVADTFANRGFTPSEVHSQRMLYSYRVRGRYFDFLLSQGEVSPNSLDLDRIRDDRHLHVAAIFNERNKDGRDVATVDEEINAYIRNNIRAQVVILEPVVTHGGGYDGVVQAGGNLRIDARETEQSVKREHFTYASGGTLEDGSAATTVGLNGQVSADLSRRFIDPFSDGVSRWGSWLSEDPKGLFHVAAPDAPYLIETNAVYADLRADLSTDELLQRLGLDIDTVRLGDGAFEARLIREAIYARTGKRFLEGTTSDAEAFRRLMENAVEAQSALGLVIGTVLTEQQMAALKKDIVWLVEKEVGGQTVLAPVLYLAQADERLGPTGALIEGREVRINGTDLNNMGTIRATERLLAALQGKAYNSGLIESLGRLQIESETLKNHQGGILHGLDVFLQTQADLINTREVTSHQASGKDGTQHAEFVDTAARIEAGNSLTLIAGGDILNLGSTLEAVGAVILRAGKNLTLGAVSTTWASETQRKRDHWMSRDTVQYGSTLSAGRLSASAGNELTITASEVKSQGDLSLVAQTALTINAAANAHTAYEYHKGHKKRTEHIEESITPQGSLIEAGGDMSVGTGGTFNLTASTLSATGDVTVNAARLVLEAAQEYRYAYDYQKKKKSFGRSKTTMTASESETAVTSALVGQNVTLVSTGDLLSTGGVIDAIETAQLVAGGHMILDAARDRESSAWAKSKKGFRHGSIKRFERGSDVSVGTSVGAQNVWLEAKDITVTGSSVIADEQTVLRATGNIVLEAAKDDYFQNQYSQKTRWGFDGRFDDGMLSVGYSNYRKSLEEKYRAEGVAMAQVGSLSGDTLILADGDVTTQAAQLWSGGDLFIEGENVRLGSFETQDWDWSQAKTRTSGFHVSLDLVAPEAKVLRELYRGGEQATAHSSSIKDRLIAWDQGVQSSHVALFAPPGSSEIVTIKGKSTQESTTTRQTGSVANAQGALIVRAGNDLTVEGSRLHGETGGLLSGKTVSAVDALGRIAETYQSRQSIEGKQHKGTAQEFMGLERSHEQSEREQTLSSASEVGSGGNLQITALENYLQRGSDLYAWGDIDIEARSISILASQTPYRWKHESGFTQQGITGAVSIPVQEQAKKAHDNAERIGQSNRDRVNAMAAANAAWNGYQAYQSVASDKGMGLKVFITYGEQHGREQTQITGNDLVSSHLTADGQVSLKATGGGEASNIVIVGSDIAGLLGTVLEATNRIELLAASALHTETSDQHNWGAQIGVAIDIGQGVSLGITFGGNAGYGFGEGDRLSWRNTHVGDADSPTTLTSGGITQLAGAQVLGTSIGLEAGALVIESLQDTGGYEGHQESGSAQATIGYGFSASGSYNQSDITADYASITEQSGIFAGDGGYQIKVLGATDLVGALITSTQAAEDKGLNRFSTGTLTFSDLKNHSRYEGTAFGLGGGFGINGSGENTHGMTPQGGQGTGLESLTVNENFGYGHDSDRERSTTRSGLNTANVTITDEAAQQPLTGQTGEQTVAALHTDITTELAKDKSGALKNNFDKDQVLAELQLQVEVSQQFSQTAQGVRTELRKHEKPLREQADVLKAAAGQAAAEGDLKAAIALRNQANELNRQADNWQRAGVLVNMIAGGLSAPTDTLGGIVAATFAPAASYGIGQYFKRENAQGSLGHILSHALLGGVVAVAGDHDFLRGAFAAGGAEAIAPAVTAFLYSTDPAKLTASQQETIEAISGLFGFGIGGVAGGDWGDVLASGMAAQNAVGNNRALNKIQIAFLEDSRRISRFQKLLNEKGYRKNDNGKLRNYTLEEAETLLNLVGSALEDTSWELVLDSKFGTKNVLEETQIGRLSEAFIRDELKAERDRVMAAGQNAFLATFSTLYGGPVFNATQAERENTELGLSELLALLRSGDPVVKGYFDAIRINKDIGTASSEWKLGGITAFNDLGYPIPSNNNELSWDHIYYTGQSDLSLLLKLQGKYEEAGYMSALEGVDRAKRDAFLAAGGIEIGASVGRALYKAAVTRVAVARRAAAAWEFSTALNRITLPPVSVGTATELWSSGLNNAIRVEGENAWLFGTTPGWGAGLPEIFAAKGGVGAEVWNLSPTARGSTIESHLAQTEYQGWFNVGQLNNGYFPLVDFQRGNTLVSLKTVDTTGSTWFKRMEEHIVDLGSRRATISDKPANMMLDIRVQPGGIDAAQPLIQVGIDNGVKVIIKEFK